MVYTFGRTTFIDEITKSGMGFSRGSSVESKKSRVKSNKSGVESKS